jgi:dinuclear metal center YbgI/SA1388 family protein
MKIKDIVAPWEEFAPLGWQAAYDNSGLVVGRGDTEVSAALLCVDVTEEVLDEAARLGAGLVISHHPIIFHALKRLNGEGVVERVVERAIREGIALYACHTNLDSAHGGMSWRLAEILGISDLRPIEESGLKPGGEGELACPSAKADGNDSAEVSFDRGLKASDTPAKAGYGVIGVLPEEVEPREFLREVMRRLGAKVVRHSDITAAKIQRVALCTGSGASLIGAAKEAGAELYIAADFRYNDFFEGEHATPHKNGFIIADIGHFESEFCAIDLMSDVISKKIATFALHKSKSGRNPVGYLVNG